MKIKEIYITAFGGLKDRKFKLGDCFNIIYGLNETGKSTLHRFIGAMLYGFVKPGIKRRLMMKEHDRYRPWGSNLYGGSLVYEHDGRLYKIERNFVKGRESARVFDGVSGEELTGTFPYDGVRRELLFANAHIKLSMSAFENTISIGQLKSKSDAELAGEIRTQIGNLGDTGDISISVDRSEKLIRKYLARIGTERAGTKEYGRLCQRIGELKENLGIAADAMESIRALNARLKETEAGLARVKKEKEALERDIEAYEDRILLNRWHEVQNLVKESEELRLRLKEYEIYSGFCTKDSDELYISEELLSRDERELQKLHFQVDKVSMDIEMFKPTAIGMDGNDERSAKIKLGVFAGFCVISATVGLLNIYKAAALKSHMPYITVFLCIVLSLCCIFFAVKQRKLLENYKEINREHNTKRQYMERHRQYLIHLLREKEKDTAERKGHISDILRRAGAITATDYRRKAAGFEECTRLKKEITQTEQLIDIRLGGEMLGALEERVKAVKMFEGRSENTFNITMQNGIPGSEVAASSSIQGRNEYYADRAGRLRSMEDEEMHLSGSVQRIKGSIEVLERDASMLPEIEEELLILKERLNLLKLEREAAGIALETLQRASAAVHHGLAPALNRMVNGITSCITGGRYTDIYITKDLNITATAPETGRRTEAGLLSSGTVDQLYFALRIAAAELLTGNEKLPLLLDDCFVQYDRLRLKSVLNFLASESAKRQIILFTCHDREAEVAKTLGITYNYLMI